MDAITVVSDGGERTQQVCKALGADVVMRTTPATDWERGIGWIAGARNEALDIAEQRTDYVLVCDPDDWFEGSIPSVLEHDVYEVHIHDAGLRYPRAQLFRSGKGYRYQGIVHETLVWQLDASKVARAEGLRYMRGHGGHQDQQSARQKYGGHARLLEKWLVDHPTDARALFYLGQSYRDAGMVDEAIAAYERRIAIDVGWDEERAFAACQIARILRDTDRDPTAAYLRAFELRPSRAEPLCELSVWLRDERRRRFALAVTVARTAASLPMPAHDSLFLEPAVYVWRALEEYAITSYWAGDKAGALARYEELLPRVPTQYREHVQSMIAMCERELG